MFTGGVRKEPWFKAPFTGNAVEDAILTVGAEATNVINVAIRLLNRRGGSAVAQDTANESCGVLAWLSTLATGLDVVSSAPSGGWAIGTNGLLLPVVTNKQAFLVSNSSGLVDVSITESGTPTIYLALLLPSGAVKVSGAITFA